MTNYTTYRISLHSTRAAPTIATSMIGSDRSRQRPDGALCVPKSPTASRLLGRGRVNFCLAISAIGRPGHGMSYVAYFLDFGFVTTLRVIMLEIDVCSQFTIRRMGQRVQKGVAEVRSGILGACQMTVLCPGCRKAKVACLMHPAAIRSSMRNVTTSYCKRRPSYFEEGVEEVRGIGPGVSMCVGISTGVLMGWHSVH